MSFQVETALVLHSDRETPVLTFAGLCAGGPVVHGITTRLGGVSVLPYHSLNLSLSVGDNPAAVAENRGRAARAVGVDGLPTVRPRQVHGCHVSVLDSDAPAESPTADALVTNRRGLALAMTYADCLPIVIVDESSPCRWCTPVGRLGRRRDVDAWKAMCAQGVARRTRSVLGPSIGPAVPGREDVVEQCCP